MLCTYKLFSIQLLEGNSGCSSEGFFSKRLWLRRRGHGYLYTLAGPCLPDRKFPRVEPEVPPEVALIGAPGPRASITHNS